MVNRLHGGNIWPYLRDLGNSLHSDTQKSAEIIDFSANINPLGFSPYLKEAIIKNLDTLLYYPEPESCHLKNCLASFHSIESNNLLVGNGSIELIYLIPRALRIKRGLVITPTFTEYEFALNLNGAKPLFVRTSPQDNFKIDVSKLARFVCRVDLVFLCNPNNPTGSLLSREEMLALLELCKKNKTFLVVDEAFGDFSDEGEKLSLVQESTKCPYLLVLRSLTKFFAFAGLRLGYLVGQQKIINRISRFQYPWSVNSLAQVAGEKVIKDKKYIKATKDLIKKERAYLFDNLTRIKGIKVYFSSSNFFLCELENSRIQDTTKLSQRLIKQGILIRNCDNFRGLSNRFFRIAVRKREENDRLISALERCIK